METEAAGMIFGLKESSKAQVGETVNMKEVSNYLNFRLQLIVSGIFHSAWFSSSFIHLRYRYIDI